MGKLSTRREMLEMTSRAAALPGAAMFFAAWLRAADHHQHPNAPPEPPLLRDYQPKFFEPDDFAAQLPDERDRGSSRAPGGK